VSYSLNATDNVDISQGSVEDWIYPLQESE
jgi:hypothetical protein